MGITRSIGFVTIGIVLGSVMTASLANGQRPSRPSNPRLVVNAITRSDGGLSAFVKDTKTSGCWLQMAAGDAMSIAVAPTEACDFK